MEAYVEIVYPDGTSEVFPIEGDQATVGRSPTATVSLPDARELEPEHLLIAPRTDGVWVSPVQGANTPVLRDGVPLQPGKVPWGAWLEIGTLKFRVTHTRPERDAQDGAGGMSPVVKVVLLLGAAALAVTMALGPPNRSLPTRTRHEPPALFDEGAATCDAKGSDPARRGETLAEAASLHDERYPFDPQDGFEALRLYQQAAACFRAAGRTEAEAEAKAKADALRRRIEDDFRHARFRLDRALTEKRYVDALREARRIAAFVEHRPGPYLEWVQVLERRLAMRVQR